MGYQKYVRFIIFFLVLRVFDHFYPLSWSLFSRIGKKIIQLSFLRSVIHNQHIYVIFRSRWQYKIRDTYRVRERHLSDILFCFIICLIFVFLRVYRTIILADLLNTHLPCIIFFLADRLPWNFSTRPQILSYSPIEIVFIAICFDWKFNL